MKCARDGCDNVVKSRRRKYCCDECRKLANHERTLERRKREVQQKRNSRLKSQKVRTCLNCSKEFLSMGPWNRICPKCTQKTDGSARERHTTGSRWVSLSRGRLHIVDK